MAKKQIYSGIIADSLIRNFNAHYLDGKSQSDFTTPDQVNRIYAEKLNSTPEQLEVIDEIKERLGSDTDLADALTDEIVYAKKSLFIDEWNIKCGDYGKYNEETGYFELNGLIDITYEQAVKIYVYSAPMSITTDLFGSLANISIRTNLPFVNSSGAEYAYNLRSTFRGADIKILNLLRNTKNSIDYIYLQGPIDWLFSGAVRKIIGKIRFKSNVTLHNNWTGADLEEIYIDKLDRDLPLYFSPNINLESMRFLVDNAENIKPITIKVADAMYLKLTNPENTEWYQLNQDAINKQIIFATPD